MSGAGAQRLAVLRAGALDQRCLFAVVSTACVVMPPAAAGWQLGIG